MSSQPETEKEKTMPSVMDQVSEMIEESGAKPPRKKKGPPKSESQPKESEALEESCDEPDVRVSHVDLRVPRSTDDAPTFRLHIDVNLTGDQAVAIRRVAAALDLQQATLANGRRCTNCNDAVRWVFEKLAENP